MTKHHIDLLSVAAWCDKNLFSFQSCNLPGCGINQRMRDFLAPYTVCSGLLKSEALSAVDLLKKAGINAFCLNSMGEVQTE
jgi:hypothetical protein